MEPFNFPNNEGAAQETTQKSFLTIEKRIMDGFVREEHTNIQDGIPETVAPHQTNAKATSADQSQTNSNKKAIRIFFTSIFCQATVASSFTNKRKIN